MIITMINVGNLLGGSQASAPMPLESLIRHYLYGRSIASARIRNFLVLEYGRVTDLKKKKNDDAK